MPIKTSAIKRGFSRSGTELSNMTRIFELRVTTKIMSTTRRTKRALIAVMIRRY
jgi:hypothetical protein